MTKADPGRIPGTEPETPAKISRRAYVIFGVVGLALLMGSLDATIVAVSLPTMLIDLRTNLAWIAWTLTGYQFSQSVIMPIAGKLSDEYGRKRVFLAAIILFTVSSVAAGLAPNVYLLIIFRLLQGIGGGAIMPSATGIISDAFGAKRATAIGLFSSIFPIGGMLGPNIGGFIVDHFSWRWIFFVNIPIGIIIIIIAIAIFPKHSTPDSPRKSLDTKGIGLFIGAVLAVLYAITHWADNPGHAGIVPWALLALGIALFVLFFRQEDKTENPMITTKMLRWRPLLAVNIYNFVLGIMMFSVFSFIPYYATVAYGMTAGQNGLVLTPRSAVMILVSALTSFFIIRVRYRPPMIAGVLTISLSLFLLSRGFSDVVLPGGIRIENLPLLAGLVMISGIGMGMSNPAANNAALDLVPDKLAAVAGMRGMFRSMGGMVGTALITLILSHYTDRARGMQEIFLGCSLLFLLLIPIVFLIPDMARQKIKIANGRKRIA